MRIGILGRTRDLISTANLLYKNGYEIPFIWTCRTEKHYKCDEFEFKKLAKKFGSVFINSSSIRKNFDLIKKLNVQVVLSINFLNLIPNSFLNHFEFGVLNAHFGDLPKYRGNACPNWAILNNEKQVFLTIHKMDEGLDSGPIYLKKKIKINNQTYIKNIFDWGANEIPLMFLDTIEKIKKGIKPKKQSINKISRCFPRKPEDSRINWNDNAEEIHRLIRASSEPLEGSYCFSENRKKVIIWESSMIKMDYDFYAIPGQILEKTKDSVIVACGNKSVLLVKKLNLILNNKKLNNLQSISMLFKSLRSRLV